MYKFGLLQIGKIPHYKKCLRNLIYLFKTSKSYSILNKRIDWYGSIIDQRSLFWLEFQHDDFLILYCPTCNSVLLIIIALLQLMEVCRINEFGMVGNIEIVQMTALLAICGDTEVSIGGDLIFFGGGLLSLTPQR